MPIQARHAKNKRGLVIVISVVPARMSTLGGLSSEHMLPSSSSVNRPRASFINFFLVNRDL